MASLARRGSCIAFQTPIGIERELAEKTLVYVPLTDKRLPADRLMVVRRQGPQGEACHRCLSGTGRWPLGNSAKCTKIVHGLWTLIFFFAQRPHDRNV